MQPDKFIILPAVSAMFLSLSHTSLPSPLFLLHTSLIIDQSVFLNASQFNLQEHVSGVHDNLQLRDELASEDFKWFVTSPGFDSLSLKLLSSASHNAVFLFPFNRDDRPAVEPEEDMNPCEFRFNFKEVSNNGAAFSILTVCLFEYFKPPKTIIVLLVFHPLVIVLVSS